MILFYIRHGDPLYQPDTLTPLGERQAESVAKRLALHGIDRIYSSTSNRAMLTAKPTGELTKIHIEELDFANECYAWEDFHVERDGKQDWVFQDREFRALFSDPSVLGLGYRWYEHPKFHFLKNGMDRVYNETFAFFKSLGYEHVRDTGRYEVYRSNNERIAFFAHAGFGMAFLSVVLDIPYPIVANHFDMCHTGITAIEFAEEDRYAVPRLLTLSSDEHLYMDGLPTKYNNRIYI